MKTEPINFYNNFGENLRSNFPSPAAKPQLKLLDHYNITLFYLSLLSCIMTKVIPTLITGKTGKKEDEKKFEEEEEISRHGKPNAILQRKALNHKSCIHSEFEVLE
ncbi:hypothetical protein NPIL_688811 [Nephila pilipes]|uniref:Uncharacterized protein n=1 Tax=Nephila pilipes TaxID=299642 RepID=A0A8X6QU91_NEPPI|nr:hypothetical protein NPIL_688811 [Nephila pilipes]